MIQLKKSIENVKVLCKEDMYVSLSYARRLFLFLLLSLLTPPFFLVD
jgi:hypothetical protein